MGSSFFFEHVVCLLVGVGCCLMHSRVGVYVFCFIFVECGEVFSSAPWCIVQCVCSSRVFLFLFLFVFRAAVDACNGQLSWMGSTPLDALACWLVFFLFFSVSGGCFFSCFFVNAKSICAKCWFRHISIALLVHFLRCLVAWLNVCFFIPWVLMMWKSFVAALDVSSFSESWIAVRKGARMPEASTLYADSFLQHRRWAAHRDPQTFQWAVMCVLAPNSV